MADQRMADETTYDPMQDGSMLYMLAEAESKRLWFWCRYQDLWLSPQELKANWEKGKFRWGSANWELRDPLEKLKEIHKEVDKLVIESIQLSERING